MPDPLTIISQRALTIPIVECGEPLVDIRRAGGLLFGPVPECPQTEPDYCLMRRGTYERLLRAQTRLPKGYRFRIYEALRSLSVQTLLFEQEQARIRARSPDLTPDEVFDQATVLVSPPALKDGSPTTPPHSTGAAVDLEIVDDRGQVIDFGMTVKDWVKVSAQLCHPDADNLSEQARANRELLNRSMQAEGFVRYYSEWWHFSYGDRYWAAQVGRYAAPYGACSAALIAHCRVPSH